MDCMEHNMEITRGTTPTIVYRFHVIEQANIAAAQLVLKQGDEVVVEKTLTDAVRDAEHNTLSFTLTQAETLLINARLAILMKLRYRLNDGKAGASRTKTVAPDEILKDGVI